MDEVFDVEDDTVEDVLEVDDTVEDVLEVEDAVEDVLEVEDTVEEVDVGGGAVPLASP
jgi:hypothetical protein